MGQFATALAVVGFLVLLVSLLSGVLQHVPLSRPLVALIAGAAVGPLALAWLDPAEWTDTIPLLVERIALLTMGIAVMAVALRLRRNYLREHWKTLVFLLLVIMPLMTALTALLAWSFLSLSFWYALLLGAILTPTDPVVATTIVTGPAAEENLPERLRSALSAEAGANDGLALPLVLLPMLVIGAATTDVMQEWIIRGLVWETGVGTAIGIATGAGVGGLLSWAEKREYIEESSFLAITLALTLLVLGVAEVLSVNGILAVFAAGIAFDQFVESQERHEEEKIQETVNHFFTVPAFALIGLLIPWSEWRQLGWTGVGFAILVLAFRRIPAMLAAGRAVPALQTWGERMFAGWFGPIGIAALYYATRAESATGWRDAWPITTLVITASVVAHGMTAAPLTQWFGRRHGRRRTTAGDRNP
jgi:sodium/hydrogen antiporter